MANDTDDIVAEARHRAGLYALLGAVFGAEPSTALLEEIRQLPVAALSDEPADQAAWNALLEQDEPALLELLNVEFTRLFIGPRKHVVPFSSVHAETQQTLWGESTRWVSAFFREVGYTPPKSRRNPPDHIANELELMHALAAAEADGDTDTRLAMRKLQRAFVVQHLGQWAPVFFNKAHAMAEQVFYRLFARLALDFIDSEKAYLQADTRAQTASAAK